MKMRSRPKLGTGMAEKAAQKIEGRKRTMDRQMSRIMGELNSGRRGGGKGNR